MNVEQRIAILREIKGTQDELYRFEHLCVGDFLLPAMGITVKERIRQLKLKLLQLQEGM